MNNRLKKLNLMNLCFFLLAIYMFINNLRNPYRHQGFFGKCSIVCSILAIIASVVYFISLYKDKKKEK